MLKKLFALMFIASFASSILAVEAGQEQEELDAIVLIKGAIPPTKITQDNYIAVIGKKGIETKVASYKVKEVVYGEKDPNYNEGVTKRDEGRWTLAALYFTKALMSMPDKKWAPEYCNYQIGSALYAGSLFNGHQGRQYKYEPPAVYFKKVLEANPKSRFLPELAWKIPACLAEQGKADEAEAALKDGKDKLAKYKDEVSKLEDGYREIFERAETQLLYAQAKVAEARGKAGGSLGAAKDAYEALRRKTAKNPELNAEAVEGLFRMLILMKDFNGAKNEANTIIERYNKNDYSQLVYLPAAYNVLGRANYQQALDNEGKGLKLQASNAYAESRWAFLHVIAQFFDNDDYVAGAHFFAGKCYDKLREVEEKDAGQKAVRHFQLVMQNFPRSEFNDLAATELKRLGVPVIEAPKVVPAPNAPAKPATGGTAPAGPKPEEKKTK